MIAHYFPPGTSSGTLRTVKFASYLPGFNWRPLILTMRPDAFNPMRVDPSLLADISPDLKVYRTPVWMPDRFLARLKKRVVALLSASHGQNAPAEATGRAQSRRTTPLDHLRNWLQFPDAYGGWLVPGLWQGRQVIKSQNIDLIYSTAPSPVAHMIAMMLRNWTGRPWVADFRDPWECLFPESVYVQGEHPLRQRAEVAVAEKVVRAADLVIANTPRLCDAFRNRFPDVPPQKFVTIPNGFAPEDFRNVRQQPTSGEKFTISHTGTFFTTLRTPDEVLRALDELVNEGRIDPARLCVKLVGCGAFTAFTAPYLQVIPRVSHEESLRIMAESDVLLLLQQSPKYWLQVPAKTFEYIASRRWILAVASDGSTRDIMASLPNGVVVAPERPEELKTAILKLYQMYLAGTLHPAPSNPDYIAQFSRREQARALATCFQQLIESHPTRPLQRREGEISVGS